MAAVMAAEEQPPQQEPQQRQQQPPQSRSFPRPLSLQPSPSPATSRRSSRRQSQHMRFSSISSISTASSAVPPNYRLLPPCSLPLPIRPPSAAPTERSLPSVNTKHTTTTTDTTTTATAPSRGSRTGRRRTFFGPPTTTFQTVAAVAATANATAAAAAAADPKAQSLAESPTSPSHVHSPLIQDQDQLPHSIHPASASETIAKSIRPFLLSLQAGNGTDVDSAKLAQQRADARADWQARLQQEDLWRRELQWRQMTGSGVSAASAAPAASGTSTAAATAAGNGPLSPPPPVWAEEKEEIEGDLVVQAMLMGHVARDENALLEKRDDHRLRLQRLSLGGYVDGRRQSSDVQSIRSIRSTHSARSSMTCGDDDQLQKLAADLERKKKETVLALESFRHGGHTAKIAVAASTVARERGPNKPLPPLPSSGVSPWPPTPPLSPQRSSVYSRSSLRDSYQSILSWTGR